MNYIQALQKWGNGTGIRLPKKVVEAAHLQLNQQLEVTLRGDSVVLTPVKKPAKISLHDLVDGVTPSDIGGEIDWGQARGAERW